MTKAPAVAPPISTGLPYKKVLLASLLAATGICIGYYAYSKTGRKGGSRKSNSTKDKLPEDIVTETSGVGLGEGKQSSSDGTETNQQPPVTNSSSEEQDANDPISSYASEKFLELAEASRLKGNKYYNAGKFEKAVECYSEAIRMYPEGSEGLVLAYSNLAACHIKSSNFEAVIEDCTKALQINPTFVKALDRRSRAFESSNAIREAAIDVLTIWYLEEGKNAENEEKLQRLMMIYAEKKASEVKELPHKLPSPVVIAEKLSIYGIKLPEIVEDENTLSNLINSNPVERGDALVKRAILHFQSGRYNAAYDDLESGVSENPEKLYEESHCLFALLNYLKNDMKSALLYVEKALVRNPKSVVSLILRASWKFELEQARESMEDLSKGMEVDPKSALPYLHRSIFVSIFNPPGAMTDAEKAIELDDSFSAAHVQLARIHMMLEDIPTAIKVLKQAMIKFPADFEILNCYNELIVSVPFSVSNLSAEEIGQSIDAAMKLKPFDPRAYVTKGTFSLKLQKTDDAISSLNKAIEVEPTFQFPYFELAMILVTLNRNQEATKYMNQGLALASSDKELLQSYRLVVDLEIQMEVLSKYPQFQEAFKKSFQY